MDVPGLRWLANGQSVLSGPLLALADRLDTQFLKWAADFGAGDYRFPTFLPASVLERIDWFRSFPQLATLPACLDAGEENLARFTEGSPVVDGAVRPTALAPIRDVLTPAACYHVYDHLAGRRLDGPLYLTTRNTCFRREERYEPLERQWSFSMREIVCVGTADETHSFLEAASAEVDRYVAAIGLPVAWERASDPFFRPSKNPQYLMQQVDPTKFELVFDARLAIASTNLHHDHFGRAFDIVRDGEPARTACIAFGIERWLSAFVHHFGTGGPWPS